MTYCDSSDLLYTRSTDYGASWDSPRTVDDTGVAGGPSLAVSGSNRYLAYSYSTCMSADTDLKFARSSNGGSSWILANMDSTGYSGQYASLGMVSSSELIVVHYDGQNNKLREARSHDGGATWPDIGAVDKGTDVGQYACLCTVAGDPPMLFVAYYDATGTHLNFAKSIDGGATW